MSQKSLRTGALSTKQPSYVFDSNGDTQLVLTTYRSQPFNWESETLWAGHKPPVKVYNRKKREKVHNHNEDRNESSHPSSVGTVFESTSVGDHSPQTNSTGLQIRFSGNTSIPISFGKTSDEFSSGFSGTYNEMTRYLNSDSLGAGFSGTEINACGSNSLVEDLSSGDRPGTRRGQVEVEMLVSGKHLELASPVFQKMLAGHYKEGKVDHQGLRRLTATDWDPEAFGIILNIIHGRHRHVPRSVGVEMLTKLAIIVDYYGCHESIDIYIDIWVRNLEQEIPTVYGRDSILWIFISGVLSRSDLFHSMTRLALQHSSKLIETSDFPIPAVLLKKIDQERQDTLSRVFSAIYNLLDRLQEESECSYECSSMLLGSLTKDLKKKGILSPRAVRPFNGFSIEGSKDMIKNFQKPRWSTRASSYSSAHPCRVQDKLTLDLNNMEKELCVFKLQDFPFT